jgi:hypothetical protein
LQLHPGVSVSAIKQYCWARTPAGRATEETALAQAKRIAIILVFFMIEQFK